MSDVRRPETGFYGPGTYVATRYAADGGREFVDERISGIVLSVEDAPDEQGEIRRRFLVVNSRTSSHRGLVLSGLWESELALDEAYPAGSAQVRQYRRRLHGWIGALSPKRMTDSPELDAERVIRDLLALEIG